MEKAAISLAIAVVSPILSQLSSKIVSLFGGDITSSEIKELTNFILPKIQTALEVAGKIKADKLRPWLMELEAAAYEADDVLDEYEYKIMKDKVSPPIFIKYSRKAKNLLAFKSKLKSSYEKLKKSAVEAEKLIKFVVATTNTTIQSESSDCPTVPSTTDATPPPRIFGRDNERDFFISKLLSEADDGSSSSNNNSSESSIPVYAIHGVGGAGKSTLAQHIYNHPRIADSFCRIWIHVGMNFDVHRIVKEIIEVSAQNKDHDITNPTALKERLKESLKGKRFLLILDDVWCEDMRRLDKFLSKWNELLVPLNQVGGVGNRVLITTRMGELASYLAGNNSHSLEELETEDCLCILKHYALGSADADINNLQLKNLADQIVSRMYKSPLAATIVGSLLKRKVNVREWGQFVENDLLKDSVTDTLLLSFNYLPSHLQRCFALCSLYRRGFFIKGSKELIRLWIAHGLVELPSGNNSTLEDIGKKYFDDLVSYSFLQAHPTVHGWFVMHDLIHQLAEKVSEGHCIRIEDEWPKSIPPTIMHLSVFNDSFFEDISDSVKLPSLRTFMNFTQTDKVSKDFSEKFLKELTKLRVLDLGFIPTDELFSSACELKHLRYLKLGNGVEESIGRLYHLQFLNFTHDYREVSILFSLKKLLNIRCIDGDSIVCTMVSKTREIGRLTSLQMLEKYHVGRTREDGIEQLKNMNQLRGSLKIMNLHNVKDKEAAKEAMLRKKTFLKVLTLEWRNSGEGDSMLDEQEVLEGLEPPPNLEKLEINKYKGAMPPKWMMLNNNKCLSNLQSLTLSNCPNLAELPSPPYGLLHLQIKNCPSLSQLPRFPPTLSALIVSKCPKLMQVPSLPHSLLLLNIKDCPDLTELLSLANSLTFLYIWNCTNLVQVPSLPHSLEQLTVKYCPQLTQLSPFPHSLEDLYIENSPSIESLISSIPDDVDDDIMDVKKKQIEGGSYQYPSSLRFLTIICPSGVAINEKKLNKLLQNQIRLYKLELEGVLSVSHLCCEMTRLFQVEIRDCLDLVSLQGIVSLCRLIVLNIRGCAKLKWVNPDEDGGPLLPSSLYELTVMGSGSMDSSNLSQCLLGLVNLTYLRISLTESFDCFPDLSGLGKLEMLTIEKCPELTSIGNLKDIFLRPTSFQHLGFNNCDNLQSLPVNLEKMPFLKCLHIINCPAIESLPELHGNLEHISIAGCPQLVEKYGEGGSLRHKINHIKVDISINSTLCSDAEDYVLSYYRPSSHIINYDYEFPSRIEYIYDFDSQRAFSIM